MKAKVVKDASGSNASYYDNYDGFLYYDNGTKIDESIVVLFDLTSDQTHDEVGTENQQLLYYKATRYNLCRERERIYDHPGIAMDVSGGHY